MSARQSESTYRSNTPDQSNELACKCVLGGNCQCGGFPNVCQCVGEETPQCACGDCGGRR